MELVGRPATELAAAVRAGELDAVDVVRAHLDHLAQVESALGAFVTTRRRAALDEAVAVDERADRAELPLAGVPVAIKDDADVAGEPTRMGSALTSAAPATADDPVVARLREAGAIVLGKTRCPELCVWGVSDDAEGVAVSPWDASRSAGGSSGGSAAAVTAGIVPIALAVDGMGSARIPAAACGAVGLRPGADLLPFLMPNGRRHWFGMTRFGPIATTVADLALALDVMAGMDRFRDVTPAPAGLDVAVSLRSPVPGVTVSRPWQDAAIEAGRLLRHGGHLVRRSDPPYDRRMVQAGVARWTQGTAEEADVLGLDVDQLQARTRGHIAVGRRLAKVAPVRDEDAERWRTRLEPFWAEHDVLVTPAFARASLSASDWRRQPHAVNFAANTAAYPFLAPWNLADVPAAVVPLWQDRGRPLAVQIVAPQGEEERVLAVAAQLEALVPWPRHAPGWGVPGAA